jgi:hypothetical protein
MVRSPMFKTQHAGLCSQGAGPLDRDNIISTRHVPTCAKARMAMSQIDCPDIRWTGCPEVWLPADLPGGVRGADPDGGAVRAIAASAVSAVSVQLGWCPNWDARSIFQPRLFLSHAALVERLR